MTAIFLARALAAAVLQAADLSCPPGSQVMREPHRVVVEISYCARKVGACPESVERRRRDLGKSSVLSRIYPDKTGLPNYLLFKADGRWTCFLPHGPSLKRVLQGVEREDEENFVEGVLDGAAVTRVAGVKTEEKHYKDGRLHGLTTRWLEDGQKFSEETFAQGLRSGPFAEWADDGQLMIKGSWTPAGLDGLFTRWSADGKKEYEMQFKEGRLAKVLLQPKADGPIAFEVEHPVEGTSDSDSCYGIAPKEIVEQQSDLAYGVACAHGDFDGNGTEDIAFNLRDSEMSFAAVFLLGPSKILAFHRIAAGTLLLYRATEKGLYGEPPTKNDGLVNWGEGGTTRIYLYNSATKKFDESQYASEDN